MFMNNQIVWDVNAQSPVIASDLYGQTKHRGTHFIECTGSGKYEVALPESVENALAKLALNLISPAPLPPTHCPHCFNWWSNHNSDGTCWK